MPEKPMLPSFVTVQSLSKRIPLSGLIPESVKMAPFSDGRSKSLMAIPAEPISPTAFVPVISTTLGTSKLFVDMATSSKCTPNEGPSPPAPEIIIFPSALITEELRNDTPVLIPDAPVEESPDMLKLAAVMVVEAMSRAVIRADVVVRVDWIIIVLLAVMSELTKSTPANSPASIVAMQVKRIL